MLFFIIIIIILLLLLLTCCALLMNNVIDFLYTHFLNTLYFSIKARYFNDY